jgi:hypothetical protein
MPHTNSWGIDIEELNKESIVAQKVKIILIDDIDGGEADETVRFGLDGVQYEIDLSETHASELRATLAEYVGAARRSNSPKQQRSSAPAASRNQEAAQIREWAKENGYNVSSRGRVNSEIVEAYRAAQR